GCRPGTMPAGDRRRNGRAGLRRELIGAVCLAAAAACAASGPAAAYTLTLAPASPKAIYLQVGVGSFTANYNAGGQPGNNTTVNKVSATVAAGAVGNGTPQAMTTDSSATI